MYLYRASAYAANNLDVLNKGQLSKSKIVGIQCVGAYFVHCINDIRHNACAICYVHGSRISEDSNGIH